MEWNGVQCSTQCSAVHHSVGACADFQLACRLLSLSCIAGRQANLMMRSSSLLVRPSLPTPHVHSFLALPSLLQAAGKFVDEIVAVDTFKIEGKTDGERGRGGEEEG